MSRYFQDEHEHQTVPFDQCREEEDELRIPSQPSFDAIAAPPPPMPTGFVPSQAAPAATQFMQSPYAYQNPVPSQPVQSQPAQDFSAHSYPMHNPSWRNQFAQSQPGQIQPGQYQAFQSQPGQIQPVEIQPVQSQPAQSQPVEGQPGQAKLVRWNLTPNYMVSLAEVANWLRIPNVLPQDLQHIHEVGREKVPSPKRACAEQLARSDRFLEWLRSPASSQLLVHANYRKPTDISGLSLFCVCLMRVLQSRPGRFLPLVFFCGLHAEPLSDDDDDDDDDAESSDSSSAEPPRVTHSDLSSAAGTQSLPSPRVGIGADGLIRSFIHQLLVWHYFDCPTMRITMTALEIHAIEQDNLYTLYEIFRRLVRMLPSNITVCCLVDGAVFYERDGLAYNMRNVMLPLSQISDSQPGATPRPLKVLITSPTNMSDARDWIAAEESILSMTELGRPGLVSDEEGLERMLASALG